VFERKPNGDHNVQLLFVDCSSIDVDQQATKTRIIVCILVMWSIENRRRNNNHRTNREGEGREREAIVRYLVAEQKSRWPNLINVCCVFYIERTYQIEEHRDGPKRPRQPMFGRHGSGLVVSIKKDNKDNKDKHRPPNAGEEGMVRRDSQQQVFRARTTADCRWMFITFALAATDNVSKFGVMWV
jgi:hypothetical protein